MKQIFYPKLAWMSIRRNSQLYTPYLLTCVGMVAMSYIVSFLGNGPMLDVMRGGDIMKEFLNIGFVILSVFALIFLFYTNSFLMRRRKRELGLYNILGMGKKNLAMVLLWEALMMGAISLVGGLFCGIALSKFSELVLINLLKEEVSYHLRLSGAAIHQTLVLFVVIFGLIFVNTLCQLHVSSPIQLLRSENVGEKPPKTNWFIALLGAVLLGGAYWLAVSIQDPLSAIIWFMVGVIMVIIATYLLFMAGSVAICRILQKNKRYYYKTNHFVSVSSMIYRMRRNGAGLASICILCTMVLVTLSSTSCLYLGAEDSLRQGYPRNIYIDLSEANTKSNVAQLEQQNQQAQEIRQIAQETVAPELLQLYFDLRFFLRIAELFDERFAFFVSSHSSQVTVRLLCLDPAEMIDQRLRLGRCAALFSATLSPPSYYKTVLGCAAPSSQTHSYALPSPFDPEHLCLLVCPQINTRWASREQSLLPIAHLLYRMVSAHSGNYLAYFPSYQYLQQVEEVFSKLYPQIKLLVQSAQMTDEEKEEFLHRFDDPHSEQPMLALAVLGGIYSEGVDLVGERLLGCAVVGTGLPKVGPQQEILRDYYQRHNGMGYDFAYRYPGMNKVLQASGRVIRTDSDHGVVLLLDDRFSTGSYRRLFPAHWSHARIVYDEEQLTDALREFWDISADKDHPATEKEESE